MVPFVGHPRGRGGVLGTLAGATGAGARSSIAPFVGRPRRSRLSSGTLASRGARRRCAPYRVRVSEPTPPAGIEPDTKDWTWVLDRPCPECGFVASALDRAALGDAVRATVPRWAAALGRPDVRVRPAPQVWSPLEYGAHVRDVLRVFDVRLRLMLAHDDPQFANWDQDATAVADRYDLQDPAVVSDELTAAAAVIAADFDAVPDDAWGRTGRRSNGSVFTVESLGGYFLHDVMHHLHDVGA